MAEGTPVVGPAQGDLGGVAQGDLGGVAQGDDGVEGGGAEGGRRLVCGKCGRGCGMEAWVDARGVVYARGHSCSNGLDFARAELTDPRRTIRTSVPHGAGGRVRVIIEDVPLRFVGQVMGAVDDFVVGSAGAVAGSEAVGGPICQGQVLAEDFAGSGVALVALEDYPRPGR